MFRAKTPVLVIALSMSREKHGTKRGPLLVPFGTTLGNLQIDQKTEIYNMKRMKLGNDRLYGSMAAIGRNRKTFWVE